MTVTWEVTVTWGGLLAGGVSDNSLKFTAQWQDAATGLYYLRARYYDPTTGRFLTRDPVPGLAALPATQHPYAYVANNPVNLTDPAGEIPPIIVAAGTGAAIGAVDGVGDAFFLERDHRSCSFHYVSNPRHITKLFCM